MMFWKGFEGNQVKYTTQQKQQNMHSMRGITPISFSFTLHFILNPQKWAKFSQIEQDPGNLASENSQNPNLNF